MPKYRNATNRVLILNGVKIPPGGIIEVDEETAKQAKGALAFVPEGSRPRIVTIPVSTGLSDAERLRLERLENMFSDMMEKFPSIIENMSENIKKEINSKTFVNQNANQNTENNATTPHDTVPVILDEMSTAESNLSESADIEEKDTDSVKTKLNKLRKLKRS